MYSVDDFAFSAPICGDYFNVTFWSATFGQSIKYFILLFNIILRHGVIYIMQKVGYPSLSKEMQRITIVTFLCYFFNTGLIITLVAADCSEQPLLGQIINGGDRGDFNQAFFETTAHSLAGTMFLNAFMPLINFVLFWGMRFFKRCRDRGQPGSHFSWKCRFRTESSSK